MVFEKKVDEDGYMRRGAWGRRDAGDEREDDRKVAVAFRVGHRVLRPTPVGVVGEHPRRLEPRHWRRLYYTVAWRDGYYRCMCMKMYHHLVITILESRSCLPSQRKTT